MTWNVYMRDSNGREIKVFNIFDHHSFRESVIKLKRKKFPKEVFAEMLKREVMYYFWSKYEYEVVVTSFPPYIDKKELDRLNAEYEEYNIKWGHYPLRMDARPEIGSKIDIYAQMMLNWDVFVDYVWRTNE